VKSGKFPCVVFPIFHVRCLINGKSTYQTSNIFSSVFYKSINALFDEVPRYIVTIIIPMAANIIMQMHILCVLENVKKCNWATHKKSGFQVCTDDSDIGCDRNNVEEGRYMLLVYNEQKSFFFVHFCYPSPHYFCPAQCAPFYANYYYFSPNYIRQKPTPSALSLEHT